MKTAEEFIRDKFKLGRNDFRSNTLNEKILTNGEVLEALVEFTKIHVVAALEAAHTNGQTWVDDDPQPFGGPFRGIIKESIIKAYPLENIK